MNPPSCKISGMVLGKFMPPHRGHLQLLDFARSYVDNLTVVVCSLKSEPIPGKLRYQWMRELLPSANVLHLTDEIPQSPEEHPEFWAIWQRSLFRILPDMPQYVFASEPYGRQLAETLGANFIPCPFERIVSGSAIREDPIGKWEFLPPCVRPYFVRRVCIFGPESTGKTTLAKRLSEVFSTVMVPEFARTHLEAQDGNISPEDIPLIAKGQIAAEEALARHANRVLICDTDLLATELWSEALFQDCPDWIRREAERNDYDLYLLTDVDVPWVPDSVRYLPGMRQEFFERCQQALKDKGRRFVKLSGTYEERFQTARGAIEELLRIPSDRGLIWGTRREFLGKKLLTT